MAAPQFFYFWVKTFYGRFQSGSYVHIIRRLEEQRKIELSSDMDLQKLEQKEVLLMEGKGVLKI